MEMVLPYRYADLTAQEMTRTEGSALTTVSVIGIIAGCVTIGRGIYASGEYAGSKLYYAGYTNKQYQSQKWFVRAGVVGTFGLIVGSLLMAGFENKFYSLVTGR